MQGLRSGTSCRRAGLGDQVRHHVAVDVGEAEVAAGVAVGEAGVVETEEAKHGGVQVVDVDRLVRGGQVADLSQRHKRGMRQNDERKARISLARR